MKIILASQSPRRRELLERMGLDFTSMNSDFDEGTVEGLPPQELVCRLSQGKARAVAAKVGEEPLIIAADTVVALDGTILGKPRDELDAFKMLSTLSGVRHQVHTGVTVLLGGRAETIHEVTDVTFRELSEGEIEDYIRTGESLDKAGGYGIQGCGALLVRGLQGDYYNVMGLPVCRLGELLKEFGVDCLHLAAGK